MMDRLLHNDTFLRVLALVLACMLWLAVNGDSLRGASGVSEKFPFPIRVEVESDMVVTHVSPPSAVVVVSGDIANEPSFPAQMLGVAVVANARGLPPGTHRVRLAAVNMPPVTYTIQPAEVEVRIERRVMAERPVRFRVVGQPAAGYVAGYPKADTMVARLSGTRSAISAVAEVDAEIAVTGASADVTRLVTLVPVDARGTPVAGVDVSPPDVIVTVPIVPAAGTGTGAPMPGVAPGAASSPSTPAQGVPQQPSAPPLAAAQAAP
ncbi:hypothetical protein GCM10010885_07450 [Alicyclobacillus cellulosilyticus]|uniref:YbbR domain-containing protein n=1 Tax=Alicyclobacillus cellulosilyticus TaxID=1003997 RepID=A0A917K4I9_9BACL|nr:CdaR family protein [Alicyclobacillus cellulosilyticus]GGJ00761.1 hypothetical protein GCM10010885_07450 [Alicyclobacillus cellulosilyticus]